MLVRHMCTYFQVPISTTNYPLPTEPNKNQHLWGWVPYMVPKHSWWNVCVLKSKNHCLGEEEKGVYVSLPVSFIFMFVYILPLNLTTCFPTTYRSQNWAELRALHLRCFKIKILPKSHRMACIHAITNPFISISVSTYAVLGFLMKPVFMKLGQRHDVLTPVLFKAASSSVKALWNPTAANLLELKINRERGHKIIQENYYMYSIWMAVFLS